MKLKAIFKKKHIFKHFLTEDIACRDKVDKELVRKAEKTKITVREGSCFMEPIIRYKKLKNSFVKVKLHRRTNSYKNDAEVDFTTQNLHTCK